MKSQDFKGRNISIFISSTFIDMETERDAVVNILIPRLEEELQNYNIKISLVDLRWGINTLDHLDEDERNERILKVCMDEIKRCRPYFIGLIGERFGWVPEGEEIKKFLPEIDLDVCGKTMGVNRLSITSVELYCGLFSELANLDNSFVCFRNPDCYSEVPDRFLPNYLDATSGSHDNLVAMKEAICHRFIMNGRDSHLIDYSPRWEENHFVGMDDMLDKLYELLKKAILADLVKEEDRYENWAEEEWDMQKRFVQNYVETFIGREDIIGEVIHRLKDENKSLFLIGESGQGKSALLSKIAHTLSEDNQETVVLFYSGAATFRSHRMLHMLETFSTKLAKLCGEDYIPLEVGDLMRMSKNEWKAYSNVVRNRYHVEGESVEEILSEEQQSLKNFMDIMWLFRKKFPNRELYMVIDALDVFDETDSLTALSWISSVDIPVLVSMLPHVVRHLHLTSDREDILQLPPFTKMDAIRLISDKCSRSSKELYADVVTAIFQHKDWKGNYSYTSPLWLQLVTHMLFTLDYSDFQRIHQRNEKDNEDKIRAYLYELVTQLPDNIGDTFLYMVQKATAFIKGEFVHKVLAYLAYSQGGLRESDLEKMLGDEWSTLNFAVFRRWFRPFFVAVGMDKRWCLTHQLLIDAIRKNSSAEQAHADIFTELKSLPERDVMKIKYGMYHLIYSNIEYPTILHYYVYDCRNANKMRYATEYLLAYIKANPDAVDDLIRQMKEALDLFSPFKPETEEQKMLNMFNQEEADKNEALRGFIENESLNFHVYERIIQTLCSQLKQRGMLKELRKILLFAIPYMEAEKDPKIRRFFLCDSYKWMILLSETEYDVEKVDVYREKYNSLIDSLKLDFSKDMTLQFFSDVTDLLEFCEQHRGDYSSILTAHMALLEKPFYEDESWEKGWLTEWLYNAVFTTTWGLLSLVDGREDHENCVMMLHTFVNRYCELMEPYGKVLGLFPLEVWVSTNTDVMHAYLVANYLEVAADCMLYVDKNMAKGMQIDSSKAYRSLKHLLKSESSYLESCISMGTSTSFFKSQNDYEYAWLFCCLEHEQAEEGIKRYPHSRAFVEHISYAYRHMGEALDLGEKHEEANQFYEKSYSILENLYKANPENLQMLSSWLGTMLSWGKSRYVLSDLQKTVDLMFEIIKNVEYQLNQIGKRAFLWLSIYYEAQYYVLLCGYAVGNYEDVVNRIDVILDNMEIIDPPVEIRNHFAERVDKLIDKME